MMTRRTVILSIGALSIFTLVPRASGSRLALLPKLPSFIWGGPEDVFIMVATMEVGWADRPTINRHIYPRALWKRVIVDTNAMIAKEKTIFGPPAQLAHFNHCLLGLRMEESGQVVGGFGILHTPHGEEVATALARGQITAARSIGFCPSATMITHLTMKIVPDDFHLQGFNFVTADEEIWSGACMT